MADLDSARADWRVRDVCAAGGQEAHSCDNCGRSGIPAANFDMHAAICQRQNWKCEPCQLVMPAAEKVAHLDAVLSLDAAFAAAMEDGVEVMKAFLSHGGDKDAVNSFSDRLLHVAVRSGKAAVTRLLLEHRADTSATNAMLDNPLQIAMKHNHKDLLLILMKHNKKVKKERAKNGGVAGKAFALPLRDVTNAQNSDGTSAPPTLSSTVKVCGPGQDICGNCGEVVPTANLGLHELRCQRQNFRCPHCSEMVPASERSSHLDTSDAVIFAAANASDVSRLENLVLHGADVAAARENGNTVLHAAVTRRDVALVIWLVEELKMNPSEKNAMNDSAIDLALRAHNEEMLLFLTLALSEADTGSETTAAIQAQLPGAGGTAMLGQPKMTEQERVLERMFQMDEVRCLQANNNAVQPSRLLQRGLPSRFQQLAHMSPIIVRTRSGPLDSPASASSDSSQDQSHDESSCCIEAGFGDDCDESTSQMLDFDGADGDGTDTGVEMAGFTVKGQAMQVATDHAGRVCDSPQLPLRQPSPSMSPITVGCLPEFMPSPLDLDDKPGAGVREKSPLEIVRRDITAAGSNLGKQLAECVARFDANEADEAYNSDDLERADLTIAEGDEEGSDCGEEGLLGQCGKGLMTMGFQVPLGGDSEEGDSCLQVFFGYVRRGIANEVLRAVRRWALDGSERDGDGNTAVHIAAIHGSTSIVELLVKEGFDCCSRNREGQTPADCAQVMGHMPLAQRIRELGWERYKDMPAFSAYTAPPPNEDADDGRSAPRQCRDAHLALAAAESAAASAAAPPAAARPRPRPPGPLSDDSAPALSSHGSSARDVGASGGGPAPAAPCAPPPVAPPASSQARASAAVRAEIINKTPPRSQMSAGGFRGRRAGIIAQGGAGRAGGGAPTAPSGRPLPRGAGR